MYEAIKLLKELIVKLEATNEMLSNVCFGSVSDINTNKDIIAIVQCAIDRIERDLAKIQEGSYIF